MKLLDKSTILSGASPWTLAQTFRVYDKPFWISAFGLGATDKICVKKILRKTSGGGFAVGNCGVTGPDLGGIDGREYVEHCGVRLCLCQGQSGLAVMEPGEYELVAEGDNVMAKLVNVIGEHYQLDFAPPTPCKDCDL